MFEDILLFIAIYFIYKLVKSVARVIFPKKDYETKSESINMKNKYKDVEEVEFKEIKNEPDNEKNKT